MNILSDPIQDKKINSYNFLVQMSMIEYYSLVSHCISNNEFQRNKVKSSKSIYSLLKQDLVNGCIIPPIVLSLSCTCDKDKLTDKAFLKKMINDEPCELTDCNQIWDFLYIDDAVDGLIKLIENNIPEGIYNFGIRRHRI